MQRSAKLRSLPQRRSGAVRRAAAGPARRGRRFFYGLMLVVLNIVVLGWLSVRLWDYLCAEPEFAVRRILVDGAKGISSEEIIRRSQIRYGMNIFKADIFEARRLLERDPLIRRAEVWRKFPGEIFIRVEERYPVAQIHSAGLDSVWLVDQEGVIVSHAQKTTNVYPVIALVLERHLLRRGNKIESEDLRSALKVLDIYAGSILKKYLDLERIEAPDDFDMILKCASGLTVHIGREDFENRLIRLLTILEDLKKKKKEASSIDLRFRHVPVVLKDDRELKQS